MVSVIRGEIKSNTANDRDRRPSLMGRLDRGTPVSVFIPCLLLVFHELVDAGAGNHVPAFTYALRRSGQHGEWQSRYNDTQS